MSRIVIPVTGKVLWATGDIRLWANVDLCLKDNAGNWRQRTFRLDTATDLTTLGAFETKHLDLQMPQTPARGVVHQQTGLEIRSGYLRFRITGLDQTEYVIPCLFLGDPNSPPAGSPASFPGMLLQPFALLDRLRFSFDKDAATGVPYGDVIIEKK